MLTGAAGAMIGFGFIGKKGHLPAYLAHDDFAIVAVADVCATRRELARKLLPKAKIYEDAPSLLSAERQLDLVDIATPPRDHASIACAALARGLHALCESPLAASHHEAEWVLAEAQRARRTFFPVRNYKFAPSIWVVREIIDSGRLGGVHLVTLDTFRTQHARGAGEWLPDWRRVRSWAGGGVALEQCAHSFYLALDGLGGDPLSTSADMTSRRRSRTSPTLRTWARRAA
jgi:predicted dehydrogenase